MNNDIYLIIFGGVITLIAYLLLMKISFFKESDLHTLVFTLLLVTLTLILTTAFYFMEKDQGLQEPLDIIAVAIGAIIGLGMPWIPFFRKKHRYLYMTIGVIFIVTDTLLFIQYVGLR